MGDVLAAAQSWLGTMRRAYMAIAGGVTIRRGAFETTSVVAFHGSTLVENEGVDGLSIRSSIADFIIRRSEYRISGTAVPPEPGDQIELADGRIYEVTELGLERCWRWHDRAASDYRIHTRYLGD